MTWTHLGHSSVRLAPGVFDDRRRLNREYLASLREAALLQNHFIEAGIGEQGWHLHPSGETPADRGLDRHWGWETPGSLLRGHFVGHWMSAAAREIAVTGDPHLRATLDAVVEALERCQREGRDVLTNRHANTTIPEILGAARAYEVTGEERWCRIVEAYWEWAVVRRGTFCTGGQTSGEIWTPPFAFAARRGAKTQEHCTVYNMIRLADVLFRWTGQVAYLDYIERNLDNGILAQQNPVSGMVTYFLPLEGGARKVWGSPTEDFWCCHGTLVQRAVTAPEV